MYLLFLLLICTISTIKVQDICLIVLATLKLEHPVYGWLILFFCDEIDPWLAKNS